MYSLFDNANSGIHEQTYSLDGKWGRLKMHDLKMQDWKMTDNFEGIAGSGKCRTGKWRTMLISAYVFFTNFLTDDIQGGF